MNCLRETLEQLAKRAGSLLQLLMLVSTANIAVTGGVSTTPPCRHRLSLQRLPLSLP
jgi:hypothetical protein